MANSDKNIIITPNIGQSGNPSISLTGAGNSSISLTSLDDSLGTLSFQSLAGLQMFGIDSNYLGNGTNNGTIFSVNDKGGVPVLNANHNHNTTLDLCANNASVRVHGHNYVESACLSLTAASISDIVNNDTGYVNFELTNSNYFITNPNLMQLVTASSPYGIKFTKPGIVHFRMSQDIITSGNTSYTYARCFVNGTVVGNHLLTNTNGQWDGFVLYQAFRVKKNDVFTLQIIGPVSAIDRGAWSYYNFLFHGFEINQ